MDRENAAREGAASAPYPRTYPHVHQKGWPSRARDTRPLSTWCNSRSKPARSRCRRQYSALSGCACLRNSRRIAIRARSIPGVLGRGFVGRVSMAASPDAGATTRPGLHPAAQGAGSRQLPCPTRSQWQWGASTPRARLLLATWSSLRLNVNASFTLAFMAIHILLQLAIGVELILLTTLRAGMNPKHVEAN